MPGAPTASGGRANTVTISFPTMLDADSISLTYLLYRCTTRIGTWSRSSTSWTTPTVITCTDADLMSGQTPAYHVEASDGRKIRKGPASTVKLR